MWPVHIKFYYANFVTYSDCINLVNIDERIKQHEKRTQTLNNPSSIVHRFWIFLKSQKMSILRVGFNAYVATLNAHPLKMQMLTGTCLGYVGDAIAQMVIEKREKYDFVRGTRMAGFTFLIWAPLANRW